MVFRWSFIASHLVGYFSAKNWPASLSRDSHASKRQQQIAVRFRTLAIQMGGVMIKVGQFLSARLDVLPRQITDELAGLQDEVQPETFEDIRAVIECRVSSTVRRKICLL